MKHFTNTQHILFAGLAASAFACGVPTPEETAQESALAVSSVSAALSTSTDMGRSAAATQPEDGEGDPKPPADDGASQCATSALVNGRLRVDFGTRCEMGGHIYSGAYTIVLSLFNGLGVVLEYEDMKKDNLLHNGELSLQLASPESAINIALVLDDGTVRQDIGLAGTLLDLGGGASDLDGSGHYDEGAGRSAFTATALRMQAGECYPSAGSMTLQLPGHPQSEIRFSPATQASGAADVVVGGITVPVTLPSC